jgi:hypothetical protein
MKTPPDPKQEDLLLSSVRPHEKYQYRSSLRLAEVARDLECTERHVINLLEEFELSGGQSGLKGFSIAREVTPPKDAESEAEIRERLRKVPRGCWRVAVSDFDAFIAKRAASHTTL